MEREARKANARGIADSPAGEGPAIVYYSRTGTTRTIASEIASSIDPYRVERIRPTRRRGYWNWLLRSFVPGSTVAIESMQTDFRDTEALFLGSPKWTVSCPPINEFLELAQIEDVPVGVFITYGGFDEQRYMEALVDRVEGAGADVRDTLLVKRDRIGSDTYHDRLNSFCRSVLE